MHREALPMDRELSGGSPVGLGVVRSPFRTAGSSREWSTGPPGGPGVVKRPSRMARSGWETIL